MKKVFLIAAVAVLGMKNVEAQVSYGIKAAPQLTNLVGDDMDDVDNKAKVGFNAGVYANFRVSDQFAIQPEIQYSTQGAKTSSSETVAGVTTKQELKAKLDYINVPVMVKWYAYDGLNFEFGPQVGFNTSAKLEGTTTITEGDSSATFESDMDIEDAKTDFGLNFGVGYEMPAGFNVGFRYTHGLSDVVKDLKAKNSVMALSVGYSF